ncbi:alkaline phosphatase-like protein [Mytilinidion resinicola]|uniref:GPI ethanolamine phosphate transferase 2 n=1 Tax=Mytilinidion resinicola TaxID=574789 RepID=A0A6A6YT43_9PEZI|nr:alkaline phosphatase-like protein [Mytilinidion resinicola]KAF2811135.1 alkaline phosphatase-like protein [Mytilinidion resinicola]
MGVRADSLFLTAANLILPTSILIFATAFFPYKPFLPGLAKYEDTRYGAPPEAPFDKVIFMVVDALRSDFVYSEKSGFKFTQSLISSGAAIPFTAHATSPTITMPRVKAITTGSIPSFLDVILNFAESDTTSTLAHQDTWLAQLKAKEGGKLVMYGDDTWLKLFPDTFSRADGTSSFFVSVSGACGNPRVCRAVELRHQWQDFTEVDNNVTRHVPGELLNSDWNAMIMHYLGLDHIGHKAGPNSPNMIPKQIEMDGIVQQIYEAIEGETHLENALFVLAGDHGMNDGGNHGGSAPGETSPALVFISPKLKMITPGVECPTTPSQDFDYYTKVEQSDIAPTLAGLLGFPVPLNNLGVFIPDLLQFWDKGVDRAQLLLGNARQINTIVKATFPSSDFEHDPSVFLSACTGLSTGDELACDWKRILQIVAAYNEEFIADVGLNHLLEFCRKAQDVMSSTASNYDVSRLIIGCSIASVSVVLTLLSMMRSLSKPNSTGVFFALYVLLYGIMMFASSYVEEEQHFWYWATSAWFFYLFIYRSRKKEQESFALHPALMLLICVRIMRRWNQTGQKYAGAPDIVHSDFLNNPLMLWSLIGATYLATTLRLSRQVARSVSESEDDSENGISEAHKLIGALVMMPLGFTAFLFKLGFTAKDAPELVEGMTSALLDWVDSLSLVAISRAIFWGIGGSLLWLTINEWRKSRARKGARGSGSLAASLFDFLSLFLITQTRAQNIPLYLLFRAMLFFLAHLGLTPTQITLSTLVLSHVSFFALGNSNAISSIDLSNAYNGVSGYNVLAVGFMLFASNWAGPIYWASYGTLLLSVHDSDIAEASQTHEQQDKKIKSWVAAERQQLHSLAVATSTPNKNEKVGENASGEERLFFNHLALLTLFTATGLLAVQVACTVLRTHLFIWTVFSPKYLYAMAWGLAFHLGINVGWGSVVWWVGRW